MIRVFSQSSDLAWGTLEGRCRALFGPRVAVHWLESGRISLDLSPASGEYRLQSRAASDADWEAADRAEARSPSAGGLSLLARRCHWLIELTIGVETGLGPRYALLGTLTQLGLGPALPEDESTLLGIRGYRQLLEGLK